MDFITLEEYKQYNSLSANTKDDDKIQFLISSVSSLIQAYLEIDAEGSKTYTEVVSVEYPTDTIFLEHYPISSVVQIEELTINPYHDSSVYFPLAAGIDYIVNASEGIITRIGGYSPYYWSGGKGLVSISYTTEAFWFATGIPADLKLATLSLVNYYKDSEYRQAKTIQGTSITNTVSQKTDFPQHIQVILDRYKTQL